jgi:hypothetical protein
MDQVEGSLYSQLRKMGLALLTAVLNAAEQGDVGPTIESAIKRTCTVLNSLFLVFGANSISIRTCSIDCRTIRPRFEPRVHLERCDAIGD